MPSNINHRAGSIARFRCAARLGLAGAMIPEYPLAGVAQRLLAGPADLALPLKPGPGLTATRSPEIIVYDNNVLPAE